MLWVTTATAPPEIASGFGNQSTSRIDVPFQEEVRGSTLQLIARGAYSRQIFRILSDRSHNHNVDLSGSGLPLLNVAPPFKSPSSNFSIF